MMGTPQRRQGDYYNLKFKKERRWVLAGWSIVGGLGFTVFILSACSAIAVI